MQSQTAAESPPVPIFIIRGQRVILDADLARLYGVRTKRFNEAFKRNARRFPGDFALQLTASEFTGLKSQIANLKPETSEGQVLGNMWSQLATTSKPQRRRRSHRPWVFTEHGAVMAANILRSARAVEMSVYVVRAFIRQREEWATNATILRRLAQIDKTLLEHDTALLTLWKKLQPLLAPPPELPQRQIGFHGGCR